MGITVDIDTGGTFTDGFFSRGDEVWMAKVETTPHDLTVGFFRCLERGAETLGYPSLGAFLDEVEVLRLSSTIGTNALIQRGGPRLGLIVTRGEETALYAPDKSSPLFGFLVPPDLVVGISSGHGEALLDTAEVLAAARQLLERGARIIVVSLRGATATPQVEQEVRAIIGSEYPRHYLGSVPVLLGTEVTTAPDDFLRTNTAAVNAYLHPSMVRYLYAAEENLRRLGLVRPLLIIHARGGAARIANTKAIDTYNSGPVAGLFGSLAMARHYREFPVVTLDIGGTSADIAVLREDGFTIRREQSIEGVPVSLPLPSLPSVGCGGGSFVRAADGQVEVGPDSAGAVPGPACYNLGGRRSTVTDADLVLGLLDAEYYWGGRRRLDISRAAEALKRDVAQPLGLSLEEASWRVRERVGEILGAEIERALADEGLTAEGAALFAFGGAGPAHACAVARAAGIGRVHLFDYGPVFSAYGSSTMDVLHVYERRLGLPLDEAPADLERRLREARQALLQEAQRDIRSERLDQVGASFEEELEVRSLDNGETLVVSLVGVKKGQPLHKRLKESIGPQGAGAPYEAALLRLRARVPVSHVKLAQLPASPQEDPSVAVKGERMLYRGRERASVPVYDQSRLLTGCRFQGPAIIEGENTTALVEDGFAAQVDSLGTIILERTG